MSTVPHDSSTFVAETLHDDDMQLPAVLSPIDLPEPELITASMDGELQRLGGAFCSVDTIIGCEHRASSVSAEAPERTIAEQHTAAWIYGAALELHRPLQLCVDARTKLHPISTRLLTFREVVIHVNEIRTIGTLRVTSPLRTALDIARFSVEIAAHDFRLIRRLAELGSFQLDDCARSLNARRNLPNKRVALERLERAFGSA